jgi:hypothetical protein
MLQNCDEGGIMKTVAQILGWSEKKKLEYLDNRKYDMGAEDCWRLLDDLESFIIGDTKEDVNDQ